MNVLKTNQSEKVSSIINIEFHIIGTLLLFDVLKKHLIGYFKYSNLEELSSGLRETQQLQNRWCKRGGACQRSLCHRVMLRLTATQGEREERNGGKLREIKPFSGCLTTSLQRKEKQKFYQCFQSRCVETS